MHDGELRHSQGRIESHSGRTLVTEIVRYMITSSQSLTDELVRSRELGLTRRPCDSV